MGLARRQPRASRRHGAATIAAAAVALAGCGGEESARVPGDQVAVVLDDFSIRPQTIRARPGRLTFTIENRGRIGHNFHLVRGGREPLEVKTVFPGDTRTAGARLRRGEYRMVCTVSNHEELGMYGKLVLR
jgi:plastocyanin